MNERYRIYYKGANIGFGGQMFTYAKSPLEALNKALSSNGIKDAKPEDLLIVPDW